MIDVVVPRWGLTMEEATVVAWLCEPGDVVDEGQAVAEIEADKVEGEVHAPVSGVLAEIVEEAEAIVVPGQVIARIEAEE